MAALALLALAAVQSASPGQQASSAAPERRAGQPEPVPPPFNSTVIQAFRRKELLNPPVYHGNPYEGPAPPPPPPGSETAVCGVLYPPGQRERYSLVNYTDQAAAEAAGAHVTHKTPCGLCSGVADLAAYMATWDMTAPVRACGALGAISRPAGLECLDDLGLTPACAEIWMDNADFTRQNCLVPCLIHLGSPYNAKPTRDPRTYLQCSSEASDRI